MFSNCSEGFIGPFCQSCDMQGTIKYFKESSYYCTRCKDIESAMPEIVIISLILFAFYAYYLW